MILKLLEQNKYTFVAFLYTCTVNNQRDIEKYPTIKAWKFVDNYKYYSVFPVVGGTLKWLPMIPNEPKGNI